MQQRSGRATCAAVVSLLTVSGTAPLAAQRAHAPMSHSVPMRPGEKRGSEGRVFAGPAAASPHGPFSRGPRGRWWDDGDYARSVGLTAEQRRRMDGVFQENRASLVSGLDHLHHAEGRLNEVSNAEHPNEEAVLTEIQNVAQARADLAKANARLTLQLRNEMTEEQLRRLDELK